ncbi:MAG: hypothetical protein KDD43_13890, partial [Bdellovibrionales bacterium]|nr:hypothetical protein [Bdellovibrionales bacterium]
PTGTRLQILADTAALNSTCVARINDDTRRIESDTLSPMGDCHRTSKSLPPSSGGKSVVESFVPMSLEEEN